MKKQDPSLQSHDVIINKMRHCLRKYWFNFLLPCGALLAFIIGVISTLPVNQKIDGVGEAFLLTQFYIETPFLVLMKFVNLETALTTWFLATVTIGAAVLILTEPGRHVTGSFVYKLEAMFDKFFILKREGSEVLSHKPASLQKTSEISFGVTAAQSLPQDLSFEGGEAGSQSQEVD